MNNNAHLLITYQRLNSFLENNQLVQANALVQKLEGMLQDIFKQTRFLPQIPPIEQHPLWPAFRCCLRIRSKILGGETKQAFQEAIELGGMLTKDEKQ
jgi:hypothetical protein